MLSSWFLTIAVFAAFPTRYAQTKEEKQLFQGLVEWVTSTGGFFSEHLRLEMINKSGVPVRGLVVAETLQAKELLMTIGNDALFTLEKFPKLRKLKLANCPMMATEASANSFRLALAFALEIQKGNRSFWYPWIRLLPTLEDYQQYWPIFAEEDLMQQFEPLPLLQVIRRNRQKFVQVEDCLRQFPNKLGLQKLTLKDLKLALATSQLRFAIDPHGHQYAAPGMDLVNTDLQVTARQEFKSRKVAGKKSAGEALASINLRVAPTLLKSGLEVTMDYSSEIGNQDLVLSQGFLLEGNPVTKSRSSVPESSEESKASSKLRKSVLKLLAKGSGSATTPKCRASTLAQSQGMIRCSLARLAWESHAAAWKSDRRRKSAGKADL